jgi:hypothetical protein
MKLCVRDVACAWPLVPAVPSLVGTSPPSKSWLRLREC